MAEGFTYKQCGLAFESRIDLMNHTRQQHRKGANVPTKDGGTQGQGALITPALDTQEQFKSLLERWRITNAGVIAEYVAAQGEPLYPTDRTHNMIFKAVFAFA